MGLHVLVFAVFCGVVLIVAAVIAFLARVPGRRVAILLIVGVALTSPLWPFFANAGLFKIACNFGGGGTHIYASFKVNRLAFYTGAGEEPLAFPWESGPFLTPCDRQCGYSLNSPYGPFSYSQPFQALEHGTVQVETRWRGRFEDSRDMYARLWIAPIGARTCLAPLAESPKCIAGEPIAAVSAPFIALTGPFKRPVDYGRYVRQEPTSQRWRWFGIERHEQHLLMGGTLVARYVAYISDLLPGIARKESCPSEDYSAAVKLFWSKVLDPNGVTISKE